MKILYIYFGNHNVLTLTHKIIPIINNLNKVGVETKGLFFTDSISKNYFHEEFPIEFFPVNFDNIPKLLKKGKLWFLGLFYKDKILYETIDNAIKLEKFDFLFMRYNNSNYSFYRFVKKYPNVILTEHNSNELSELKSYFKSSSKLYWKYQYFNDKIFAPRVFPYLASVCGVSEEITHFEASRSKKHICNYTLSNGIEVDKIKIRSSPHFDNNELNMIYLVGKSGIWLGIDRLISGLKSYNGNVKIKIYLVGDISNEVKESIKSCKLENNIIIKPPAKDDELDDYFDKCHIAVGLLAIHRRGLMNNSTLKILQYLARGIPFFLANDETDLIHEKEIEPYFLKVPNNDNPIDFNNIYEFAQRVLADPLHSQKMRAFAKRKIDFVIKMKAFKKYLENLN